MPFSEEREYRSMQLRARAKRAEDSEAESYMVEGYCTTYNEPYELYSYEGVTVYEQVAPGAFKDADLSDVIMQYNHEGHVYARLSNKTMELTDDEHGLKVTANLGGTEIGRQLYEEIAGGYTEKMSFGFTIAERKQEITENEDGTATILNIITKVKRLYDVSAVSLPANPGTEIEATRSAYLNGVIEEARKEIAAKREADKLRKLIALKIKLMEV